MDNVENLVALDAAIQELWGDLAEVAPELTTKLRELLSEVSRAEDAAKKDLRSMGAGSHQIGNHLFQVKTGGTKTIFDVEDVVLEAEDYGHVETLLETGFLTYAVDSKQLDRLPEAIRPIYQGLATTKKGTPRVYLPKGLCRKS